MNGRASFELFIEKETFTDKKDFVSGNLNKDKGSFNSKDTFNLRFLMRADDASALRAVFTLIIKTIQIFEKSKQLVEK